MSPTSESLEMLKHIRQQAQASSATNAPVENVVIGQTLAMATGTQVTATIAGYNGSWTCLGAADGRVSGVAYKD